MSSLLFILLSAVLVNATALRGGRRWRPFAAAGTFEAMRALALATLILVPVVAGSSWLLEHVVLAPLALDYLRTPAFVAIVLTVVPLTELVLRRYTKLDPERPGFALLMTSNAMLLGVALLAAAWPQGFFGAVLFALAAAAALAVLLLCFAALDERLWHAQVPAPFRGAPLALVTAGLMALAFMGFTGLVQP